MILLDQPGKEVPALGSSPALPNAQCTPPRATQSQPGTNGHPTSWKRKKRQHYYEQTSRRKALVRLASRQPC